MYGGRNIYNSEVEKQERRNEIYIKIRELKLRIVSTYVVPGTLVFAGLVVVSQSFKSKGFNLTALTSLACYLLIAAGAFFIGTILRKKHQRTLQELDNELDSL